MAKSLYICYFGVREPLVQTQVIPYLRELVKGGHELTLLTFEPERPKGWETEVRDKLSVDGIDWQHLRYHKRPSVPATLYDIANAASFIRKLNAKRKFDIFHARSHVPMMMAAAARKVSGHKPKLLFDIRGFMPEEYVDAGVWPEGGAIYRNVKKAEARLMEQADGFVVLTHRAREILADKIGQRPVEVIPCCVDLKRFEVANEVTRAEYRSKLGIGDRFVMAYVGAFGGWYLTRETAELFGALKRSVPDAFAMILTQSDPEIIRPMLSEQGYSERDILIDKVPSADVPKYLSAADTAVSFIKNCYSKQASSPTKNAEYLACGLPLIVNAGIGDVDKLIEQDSVGAIIDNFSPEAFTQAFQTLKYLGNIAERCRDSAKKRFDLVDVGGNKYKTIYTRLMTK